MSGGVLARLRRVSVPMLALAVTLAMGSYAMAQDPVVTLFDIGVDTGQVAEAIGTGLGAVVATVLTIFGAFLVVRYGLRWIRQTVK